MSNREIMQQALEALEFPEGLNNHEERVLGKACAALRAALAEDALQRLTDVQQEMEAALDPVAWMPIGSAPKGRIVLVYYKNSLGNGRTMRARYYLPETLDSDTTESGWADEGWYEESEAYEYLMPLNHEPTHWMPLPPAPGIDHPPRNTEQEPVVDCPRCGHCCPQRKPLTINEVEQILAQHNYEIHGDRARYIVRMTEEAPGIGEKHE